MPYKILISFLRKIGINLNKSATNLDLDSLLSQKGFNSFQTAYNIKFWENFEKSVRIYANALKVSIDLEKMHSHDYIKLSLYSKNSSHWEIHTAISNSPYADLFLYTTKDATFETTLHEKENLLNSLLREEDDDTEITETMTKTENYDNVLNNTYTFEGTRTNISRSVYCIQPLYPLANALLKNILSCPYTFITPFPSDKIRQDGHPDKRIKQKSDALQEYQSFSNDIVTYSMVPNEHLNKLRKLGILAFNNELQHAIYTIGGPIAIEYFSHLDDITYKNENINDFSKIRNFFKTIYRDTIEDTDRHSLESIFNYFCLDTLFSGSFLYTFCNFFTGSSSNNIVKSLDKINDCYLDNLSELYCSINTIKNPFLKCNFLEAILYPSYYYEYSFHETSYPAGKEDIQSWMENIQKYCEIIAANEFDLYHTYLAYESDSIPECDIANAYLDLFKNSTICPASPQKRGQRYKPILLKITSANFNYYSSFDY